MRSGAVAVLGKLVSSGLSQRGLDLLRDAQYDDVAWKLCLHVAAITAETLTVALDPVLRRRVRYSFLLDVGKAAQATGVAERLAELTRLDEYIGRRRARFR